MTAVWYLENGELTHDDLAEMVNYSFSPPIPATWWSVENGVLTTAVLPPADTHEYIEYPFPMMIWYINEKNLFTHAGLPEIRNTGAFMGCANLRAVSIPESVKYIGPYAFADTALTSVKIAADCTYCETSFPQGCTVNFYPSESE